jgi:U3 small nucleolar RNA-associated protein 14
LDEDEEEDVSQDDDEDEEEEEDGEDFMDLSEMLNGGDDDDAAAAKKQPKFDTLLPGGDSDEEQDNMEDFSDDDQEDDEEDAGDMLLFVSSLPTKKRKNLTEDGKSKRSKRMAERTEAYDESEFSMPAHSHSVSGAKKKLDLADMMVALDDESGFSALKKNLQELEGSGKSKIKETLAAPLPKRIQDRLNRQAAYKEAKKEVGKWQPLVKQNREVMYQRF